MSLLWMEYESEFEHLVEAAFQRECAEEPEYFDALSQRVRKIIYRDTRYNIDYLYTAYVLNEDHVMTSYAVWLYKLMAGILKELTPRQTAEYVIHHLEAIRASVPDVVSADKQPRLQELLQAAKVSIRDYVEKGEQTQSQPSRYEAEIKQYMGALAKRDARLAMQTVTGFLERGISLDDIYVEILSESMRRVGELWHTAKITVDAEHYCTSVTQMAMAQMYPHLFSGERKDKTVLCVCPGMELHEMGARIVADLFANDGWDSIFLGAAVPVDYIMASVKENHPDLLTLSVSMPQHLMDCREVIDRVKAQYPHVKIAVGGKAFDSTDELWRKWPVDIYTKDARELLEKANSIC